jgi:hypothetical protein
MSRPEDPLTRNDIASNRRERPWLFSWVSLHGSLQIALRMANEVW